MYRGKWEFAIIVVGTLMLSLQGHAQQSSDSTSNFMMMWKAEKADNYQQTAYWANKVIQEGDGRQRSPSQSLASIQRNQLESRAAAEAHLARFYDQALGMPQDYTKSAYWYQRAVTDLEAASRYPGASQGQPWDWWARLGSFYATGLGVPKDKARARAIFASLNYGTELVELLDTNRIPTGSLADVKAAVTRLQHEKAAQREAQAAAEARRQAAIEARNPPPRSRSSERPSSWEPSHPSALGCHIMGKVRWIAGCPPWGW
jgi:ribosomal protein L12E/L44/L45/RPP1/RPP2